MNCSPLQDPVQTTIPPAIRDWIGRRLSGPPRGRRLRHPAACLFALGRIGDFVLTLSALRLLVRHFGEKDVVLVVPHSSATIAQREFPGVRRIVMPADAAGLVREIIPAWWREREKFAEDRFARRICLSHQRGLYYETALTWIDADEDLRLMPATYPAVPETRTCTELLAHWRLVETVLQRKVDRSEILPAFHQQPMGEDGRLLVYPLSLVTARTVPASAVIPVLSRWRQRSRAPIILGGTPADTAELTRYAEAARQVGIDRISIETPSGVDGLLAHIAGAGAVFAADSAPAHIALALDKRAVVLMRDYLVGYCQPWGRSERQQVFPAATPAETVAAALPAL